MLSDKQPYCLPSSQLDTHWALLRKSGHEIGRPQRAAVLSGKLLLLQFLNLQTFAAALPGRGAPLCRYKMGRNLEFFYYKNRNHYFL